MTDIKEAQGLEEVGYLASDPNEPDIGYWYTEVDSGMALNYDPLCRLSDAQAVIDQLRERVAVLENKYQRDVYGLNNESDPIGGDPAGGYANDNVRLRAELDALKSAPVVMPERLTYSEYHYAIGWNDCLSTVVHLNRSKT